MPLCPRLSKATMSPGCIWLRETGAPSPYWRATPCGSETPTCAKPYITKPEQSKPLGDSPPQTYGTPRYCIAIETTSPRAGVDTGAGADEEDAPDDSESELLLD